MRMTPKMSDRPLARRKRSAPYDRPLNVWMTQKSGRMAGLGVNCHEIVRGRQEADGRTTVKRAMAALPIVVVQPRGQGLGAGAGTGIGAPIGPLAQQGLDEALGLAVGA